MTTYAVESLATSRTELEELLPFHWQEIARDKGNPKFDLKPDWPSYHALEAVGQFFMMVCRVDGRMVGYHLGFIRPQLHYADSLAMITDIFFILPEYRAGRIGIQLFKESEKACRARGVDKIYVGCKVAKDLTPLFERLEYAKIEFVFAKVLV